MTDLVAVILAGGEGRRIGGNKPAVMLAGRCLIDRAISHVSEWHIPARVAVRVTGQTGSARMPEIHDDQRVAGPLGGLLAALTWAKAFGARRVITIPCDMPNLPEDLKTRLDAAAARFDRPAVASSLQRRHPVCAVWPIHCLELLRIYADDGRLSLMGALEICAAVGVDWPVQGLDPFHNVNTMDDLALARRLLRGNSSDFDGIRS
ncbi:MAG: molybdenum cofactor guanylyltransferase [Hyphomonas sp.]